MNKKLLVLTPRFPYPVIGGDRLRIYEVCKALARNYDLTLLSLCETQQELNMPMPDDGVFHRVERVLLTKWRSYLNCMFALLFNTPLQVAYYRSGDFEERFSSLLRDHDAVLCHLIRTSDYALGCGKPTIVEFTDAISLNYSRVREFARHGGLKNFIYSMEQSRLEVYEKLVGAAADLNVFVSAVDADHLFPVGGGEHEKTLVCSNGVDITAYPFTLHRKSKEIAFIGNMQSVQNMDAALWFAKEVMPFLIGDGYSFKVIGRISSANKSRLSNFDNVVVTGSVNSVVEAIEASFIGVCPMRIGAGVQNKILEYMALGLPCITSSLGYEGLQAVPNKDLFIIDKPVDIAKKIRLLYEDASLHSSMAISAREYVESQHSWVSKLKPLVDSVRSLVS